MKENRPVSFDDQVSYARYGLKIYGRHLTAQQHPSQLWPGDYERTLYVNSAIVNMVELRTANSSLSLKQELLKSEPEMEFDEVISRVWI